MRDRQLLGEGEGTRALMKKVMEPRILWKVKYETVGRINILKTTSFYQVSPILSSTACFCTEVF